MAQVQALSVVLLLAPTWAGAAGLHDRTPADSPFALAAGVQAEGTLTARNASTALLADTPATRQANPSLADTVRPTERTPAPLEAPAPRITFARAAGIPSVSEILAGSELRSAVPDRQTSTSASGNTQRDAAIPTSSQRGLSSENALSAVSTQSAQAALGTREPSDKRAMKSKRHSASWR